MKDIVRRMDAWGKPAWITAMVVGFIVFWPIGLGLLGYLIWSGRMGSGRCGKMSGWARRAERAAHFSRSSGNTAFDEYRDETLKRLEDEQREFTGFLDRLRQAKDKAEFDDFMAERRAGKTYGSGGSGEPSGEAGRDEAAGRSGGFTGPTPSPAY